MSYLVYGRDEVIMNWIVDKIDHMHNLDTYTTIGLVNNYKLIAGVAYHDYRKRYDIIQMSMAAISPMWAKKDIISRFLRYPFEESDCFKIMISIKSDNIKSLKTFKHIGFVQEAILQHVYGENQHATILQMLKPDYNRTFGVR